MTRKQNGHKRIEFNRRKFLQTATVAGVGVSGVTAFSGSAAAHPPGCDVLVEDGNSHADASTVSGGVSAASAGDTVCVAEDTYTEQVLINKDLTLENVPGDEPTIAAPSSPTHFELPDGNEREPVVFAFGGATSGSDPVVVSGSGTVDVDISGFTVDGSDNDGGDAFPVGILHRNVKPEKPNEKSFLEDNTVTRMFEASRTFGINVEGDSALKIQDNEVEEQSRATIFVDGDAGTGPDPEVDIRNNTVKGPNRVDDGGTRNDKLVWAPNGIQVSSGATGKVVDNTVTNHWGPALGSGIILVDSDGILVKGNSLEFNELAIFFGRFFEDPPVGNADIKDNDIFGGDNAPGEFEKMDYGTYLFESENSKVVNNDYDTWDNGVLIDGGENNKIVANSFTDVDNEIIDSGDDTKNPPNPANP